MKRSISRCSTNELALNGRSGLFREAKRRDEMMMMVVVSRQGWGRRVNKVCPCLKTTHGSSSTVIGTSSFFRSIKCPKPPPLLWLWVPYLSCITAPRPPPYSPVPHCSASTTATRATGFPQWPLVGVGVLLLVFNIRLVRFRRLSLASDISSIEPDKSLFHGFVIWYNLKKKVQRKKLTKKITKGLKWKGFGLMIWYL